MINLRKWDNVELEENLVNLPQNVMLISSYHQLWENTSTPKLNKIIIEKHLVVVKVLLKKVLKKESLLKKHKVIGKGRFKLRDKIKQLTKFQEMIKLLSIFHLVMLQKMKMRIINWVNRIFQHLNFHKSVEQVYLDTLLKRNRN